MLRHRASANGSSTTRGSRKPAVMAAAPLASSWWIRRRGIHKVPQSSADQRIARLGASVDLRFGMLFLCDRGLALAK